MPSPSRFSLTLTSISCLFRAGALAVLAVVPLVALAGQSPVAVLESEPVPGIVCEWSLLPVRHANDLAAEQLFDGQPTEKLVWTPVRAEAGGLVDIARYLKPLSGADSKIWARTTIEAERKEVRPFAFGYGGDVSIYLNGRIVFHGENGCRQREPASLGGIGWDATVYLPLEQGENDLVLAVTGTSGGWGFMARDLSAVYRHESLRELWSISGQFRAPESVAYDAARRCLYVTNFNGEFVSKVGLDGTVLAEKWVAGLKGQTGTKLVGGRLFVVDRSGIVEIDPETGAIVGRQAVPGAKFINDLALDETGAIYVTDSFGESVYRLSGGTCEVWITGPEFAGPNGILVEKDRVLVGVTSDGTLKAVDRKTKAVSTFLTLGGHVNMDGLTGDGEGGYLFSDYYGRIYRADAAGRRTLLLDSRGPHGYCADFEYVPELGLLVVPALFGERLTAFELKLKP